MQNRQQREVDDKLFEWMCEIRRHIHQNPELSYLEVDTAAYIRSKLNEVGIQGQTRLAGTGLIAETGRLESSLTVGLRADMDGLPITEETGLPYASVNPGIMHACGHDGHVAMLLGAAALLQQMDLPGKVRLLFQPAEEKGNGAAKMIEAGAIEGLAAIFAGHIDTHYPTGYFTVDEGIVCAYADPFIIKLKGSGGHAARPHESKDAILAVAGLITSLQSLVAREVDPNHAAVLTVGRVEAGDTHNVIAGDAHIEGTVRSTHPVARARMLSGLTRIVKGNAVLYGVKTDLEFPAALPAVINNASAAAVAAEAAATVITEGNILSQGPSSLGGEDFAFYLEKINGCLIRFGAQLSDETGSAHSSTFNFDEAVLPLGAAWYAQVALQFLQNSQ
ncbi:MAG: amidohydrolase [Desulfocapsa sp.]|nr:amidohydrolase [Desulfocapsa sp.]